MAWQSKHWWRYRIWHRLFGHVLRDVGDGRVVGFVKRGEVFYHEGWIGIASCSCAVRFSMGQVKGKPTWGETLEIVVGTAPMTDLEAERLMSRYAETLEIVIGRAPTWGETQGKDDLG